MAVFLSILLLALGSASANIWNASMKPEGSEMSWDANHRLSTIHKWMLAMQEAHPKEVTVVEMGKSTLKKSLLLMKISFPGKGGKVDGAKPEVFIEAGIHGNEWIAPAAATYIANRLISSLTPSGGENSFREFDWYILPVMNPDGYEFTAVATREGYRWFRKSISRYWNHTHCFGVDLNRNFDYQMIDDDDGSYACQPTYPGPAPASEPEVWALQSFLKEHSGRIKLYVSLHCFSQYIMFEVYPNDTAEVLNEHRRIGQLAADAIKKLYNQNYTVGRPEEILYAANGTSIDYARAVTGVDYAFVMELRPHFTDQSENPFGLPCEEIVEASEETFAAVRVMAQEVAKNLGISAQSGSRSITILDSSTCSTRIFIMATVFLVLIGGSLP